MNRSTQKSHPFRPPLPSGSPSAANRFAHHPHSPFFRLSIGHRPSFDFPGSTSIGLHPCRPPTPFHACSDHLPHKPSSSLHSRSFSYDDQSLSKDRPIGSSTSCTDLDDIIGRSVSRDGLMEACSAESTGDYSPYRPTDQLSLNSHHQRSLSLPASPIGQRTSRVRFHTAAMPSKVGTHRLADQSLDSPGATASSPPTNTGSATSTELPVAELDPFRPEEIDLYHPLPPDDLHSAAHQQPPPFHPSSSPTTLGPNQDQQQPPGVNPPSADHQLQHPAADATINLTITAKTDLPPQTYPGKLNPLLPPPTPAPRPAREISFPRPFRRRLSLEPFAIQLPPSPPPEFDFSQFENPLPQSNLYSLLDDSPCMSNHSVNEDLLGRPLIDLTDKQEEPNPLPSRTPYSHFTPLNSPVISEKPFLSSILSSPLTEYLPSRHRNRAKDLDQSSTRENQKEPELSEILRSLNESITNSDPKPASHKTTPRGENSPSPPRPPSDRTAPGPAERQTAHNSATQTPRNQSSSRGHSKPASFPPSPRPVDRVATATVASPKRSHSRAPSVRWSTHHSPAANSGPEPLTEEALRLHQPSERIHSGNSVTRSQADPGRPGGDVAPSPRPTDVESRATRWEAGEAKDDELASLVDTINQRNEERTERLTGLLRTVSRKIQEHDRQAEAETAMIRELSRSRQSQLGRGSPGQLGELAGEECGGSQFSAPFGSPRRTIPPPASVFSPAFEPLSHLHSSRPSLAGDMTTNIREASLTASLRAQALMDNIRASRASSIRASAKMTEMASHGLVGQEDDTGPGSVRGSAKAASVAGTTKAASVGGMAKAASVAGKAKTASVAGTVKAPSVAETIKAPSEAGTIREGSVTGKTKAASVAASTKARSTRTAASLHEPSAASKPSAPASRAPSIAPSHRNSLAAPSNRAPSITPSARNPSRAPSLLEPSVAVNSLNPGPAGSVKAPSIAGTTKAPSVTGTTKAPSVAVSAKALSVGETGRAPSVAGTTKAPSITGTAKEPSIAGESIRPASVAGTPKAPSVAESKAGSAAGAAGAPSVAGSVRTGAVAPSVRAPTEVIEEQDESPGSAAGECPESAAPPGGADEAIGEDGGDGDGEGEEKVNDDLVEEEPNPPAPPEDNLVKSAQPTLVGSLDGELVAADAIIQDENQHTGPVLKHSIIPTAVNPLGEWIRFGRAGFKFHILDPSPSIELDEHPVKLP